MASQLFEAPSHEAHYSSPEAHELHESPYSNPEAHYSTFESGYSSPEAHELGFSSPESHEYEAEFETAGAHYSSPEAHEYEAEFEAGEAHEYEAEFGAHETHEGYSNPEYEWEAHESGYSNPEFEYELEGEYLFGGLRRLASRVGRVVAPLAKRFAPQIARSLVSLVPGVGGLLAPAAGQLVGQLVSEAEGEAEALQAEFFGSGEGELEVANTESAHEAALAELLAAQAAESTHEGEAESFISASLPITIRITGGTRATRRVLPVLAKANHRLVRTLRSAGPDGRQLLRLVPQINAQTSIALRNARRTGRPVTAKLATQVMATVARRVLSNSPRVARTVARNIAVRHTVAPAHRHVAGIARCPGCVGRSRAAVAARSAVRTTRAAANGRGPVARRPRAPR
jgi:hypothetical protein